MKPGAKPAVREKIVDFAITLMAKYGFADTSFQKLADKLGLSQTAVLYHFPNKDILIENVIQRIVLHNHSVVSSLIEISDSAEKRLQKHFQGNLEWAYRYPAEAQVLVLLYYMACFNPIFQKKYSELLDKARLRVEEHLHAGLREGVFKFKDQPKEMSKTLHDCLVGGFINTLTVSNEKSTLLDLNKRWKRLFQALLK